MYGLTTLSNFREISEIINLDVARNGPGLISGSQGMCTEELNKATKPLSQQSIFWPGFERVTWRIAVTNVATRSLRRQHECRRKDNIKTNIKDIGYKVRLQYTFFSPDTSSFSTQKWYLVLKTKKKKCKTIPLQVWTGTQEAEAPRISRHSVHESTKVVSPMHRLGRPQGHSDPVGNRTRDLPACSAVPQPSAPPRFHQTQMPTYTQKIFQES